MVGQADKMAALPLGKLAYLAVKQLSKPLARLLKTQATQSPVLKSMVLPIGQGVCPARR